MDFVHKALARRLESAEEVPQVKYAEIFQKLYPNIGAAVESICGGHMIFAGVGSPIGRVTGAGFERPATAADLDRIEEFYRAKKAPSQVDVCPLTDSSLMELLKERNYTLFELNNVLFRRLDRGESFPSTNAAVIRPGRKAEASAFADVVGRSFFPDGNSPIDMAQTMSPLFQMDGAITFVAEVDGKIAACAAGLMIPEHGIIALFGAGTLAEYRRRGLQTALLQVRMAEAAKAGCEFAVIVTQGGTTSQRNAERLGFRVAYSKATMLKQTG
ncbi:MAG TPA: GNAT family N-acetyltransferase [Terriglobales bacterium]|nr:GNAT family N-acetyltransferase [Terriglobales bacterium]